MDQAKRRNGTDTLAPVSWERQEVDIQISTAKQYPRDLPALIATATQLVTSSETIAQGCHYPLRRRGKGGISKLIVGPSIRFAEIMAGRWGNCRVGSKIIDDDGKMVHAEGRFWDLESNSMTVRAGVRRLTNWKGERYNDDMVAQTYNAASSVAIRNATLAGISEPVYSPVYEAARQATMGEKTDRAERVQQMVDWLGGLGIDEPAVWAAVGISARDEMTADEYLVLRAMAAQIADGDLTLDDAFRGYTRPAPRPKARRTTDDLDAANDQAAASDRPKAISKTAIMEAFAARGVPEDRAIEIAQDHVRQCRVSTWTDLPQTDRQTLLDGIEAGAYDPVLEPGSTEMISDEEVNEIFGAAK